MTRFTDEQIMAFADGECSDEQAHEIRSALSADPALRARLAVFEESRRALRNAFEAKRAEAVPDRLMGAFGRSVEAAVRRPAAATRRRSYALALAASILVAVALSIGYLAGGRPQATLLPDSQLLTAALESTASGVPFVQQAAASRRELVPIRTLRTAGGAWCREFRFAEVAGETVRQLHGLACRSMPGGWSMRAVWPSSALPGAADSEGGRYRLASGPAVLAELGPSENIDSAREAELIANGWR